MRRFVSKDSKRDFYILYTLVFGVIAGFIYYQFAGNGKSLVWSHDGIPQHLNSLAYYGYGFNGIGSLEWAVSEGGSAYDFCRA